MGTLNRRGFNKGTALTAAGIVLGNQSVSASHKSENISAEGLTPASYDIMKEVMKYPKIERMQMRYSDDQSVKSQLDYADRLGINRFFIAVPIAKNMTQTADGFISYNNLVIDLMKKYPDRMTGQFTLHPAFYKESVEEMKRCIDLGMVGMKLYNQVKINDPLFYPIIEKYIDYKMIIHVHVESQIGVGGYIMKYDVKNTPTISVPEEFAEVAVRYPEAMFQFFAFAQGELGNLAVRIEHHPPFGQFERQRIAVIARLFKRAPGGPEVGEVVGGLPGIDPALGFLVGDNLLNLNYYAAEPP